MLSTLKALFEQALAPNTGAGSAPTSAERLNLSTAVLLVEVMRADGDFSDGERRAVAAVLRPLPSSLDAGATLLRARGPW